MTSITALPMATLPRFRGAALTLAIAAGLSWWLVRPATTPEAAPRANVLHVATWAETVSVGHDLLTTAGVDATRASAVLASSYLIGAIHLRNWTGPEHGVIRVTTGPLTYHVTVYDRERTIPVIVGAETTLTYIGGAAAPATFSLAVRGVTGPARETSLRPDATIRLTAEGVPSR